MAKQCELCSKKANKANKVSFSNKHHAYKQQPNLHSLKVEINGTVKTVQACTSCIKANKYKKVV
ncbi:MAG: 50S ribosomal protein L28 [Candidatus Gastranaerophilales bacterium]|jgi:large subunit ribosomal protein L28|nr:50S ribosomal protein L28 [Candidatus Gastranaerophilales bacterium]